MDFQEANEWVDQRIGALGDLEPDEDGIVIHGTDGLPLLLSGTEIDPAQLEEAVAAWTFAFVHQIANLEQPLRQTVRGMLVHAALAGYKVGESK